MKDPLVEQSPHAFRNSPPVLALMHISCRMPTTLLSRARVR